MTINLMKLTNQLSFCLAGSPYFKSMFSSGMMETHGSCLELPDIDKETFAAFREYIYTGNENITQDNVVQLLRAAAIFQVQNMIQSCKYSLNFII